MPVKVRCSGCEKVLNAPDKLRGKTVKCPKCQSPIKIPAPQKKKEPAEPDPFGDDFLADLDLTHAEDRSQSICPRCGAPVTDDDIDCPACGASLLATGGAVASAGGRGPVGSKKKKGPNKALFFQSTWGDAWEFLQKNKSYAIKTSLLTFFIYAFYLCFLFMFNWCINLPPKAFWGLLVFVFYMVPIGWVWHFVTETIKASLVKQSKLKRVHFDFFTSVAYGIKFFAWEIVCGLPILLISGVIGGFLITSGAVIPAVVVMGLSSLLIYSLLPVAMTHMAMPQQGPGWNPLKVLQGWAKSIGAISYWLLILLITSLPVTGALAAIPATSANKIAAFQQTMISNNRIHLARQEAEQAEKEGNAVAAPAGEPVALPWNNLVIPGVLLSVALLLTGPVVVFNARIVGQIAYYYGPEMDLNALEKQVKYKAKPKPGEGGEKKKINRQGLSTVATGLNLMLSAIVINVLCQVAGIALGFFEGAPPVFQQILGFIILGCGVLFLIGVLLCFATPGEARARGFLFLSFASPFIAIILAGTILAGMVKIDDIAALAIMALVIVGGAVVCMILTFVFFILYLKRLSEYLYYYAGAELADSILFLYVAIIGMWILIGAMFFISPLIGLIAMGVLGLVILGLEISILAKLITLLGSLKEECHRSA